MLVRPRRSVLYMPGLNTRALEKAKTVAADCLILDLEDSVAPDSKKIARERVCHAVKEGGYGSREIIIRVNALETPWGMDDIVAACQAAPDAILIPKVSFPGDVTSAVKILESREMPKTTRLWAMIETPMGILNIADIAAEGEKEESRLACFVLGTNDLLKETRAQALDNRFSIVSYLSMTLIAARAYGLDVLDGVYNDFKDESGLRSECQNGRALGMDGKTLIHPAQIAPCNEIFSPSHQEVCWARKVISAFSEPENADKGVITVEGRMVERLHKTMAERTVAIADAISLCG